VAPGGVDQPLHPQLHRRAALGRQHLAGPLDAEVPRAARALDQAVGVEHDRPPGRQRRASPATRLHVEDPEQGTGEDGLERLADRRGQEEGHRVAGGGEVSEPRGSISM
jgi:hypothetical protein